MLHVFSTNRFKFMARTPTTTIKKGEREMHKVLNIDKNKN